MILLESLLETGVSVMAAQLLKIRSRVGLEDCLDPWLLGRELRRYWEGVEIEAGAEAGERKSFRVEEEVEVMLKRRNLRRAERRRVVGRLTLC